MNLFIAVAALATIATAAVIVIPFVARGREAARAAKDAAIYRDQLAELDREVERGTVSERELAGSRAEISRRLIAATERAERAGGLDPAPRRFSALAAAGAWVAVPLVAVVVYLAEGAPGMPDLPFAERQAAAPGGGAGGGSGERPSQEMAESMQPATPDRPLDPEAQQFAEMIGRLERVLENRPDDARGHRLLADGYARLGRHAEAWRTYETLIDILGGDAEPALHAAQAESMIRAAGGYVSPEAEAALSRALLRDPSLPIARLYQGLAQAQRGRLGQAVATWEALEADAAEDAPWRGALERMLARARDQQAGGGTIARAAPSTGGAEPGPGRADMEAAAEMSREERQAMITGMVQSLDQRLAEEGGGPEEWVRLIRARMQLGETEAAREAYRRSQEALEGSEAGFVRERALLLGVIEQ